MASCFAAVFVFLDLAWQGIATQTWQAAGHRSGTHAKTPDGL